MTRTRRPLMRANATDEPNVTSDWPEQVHRNAQHTVDFNTLPDELCIRIFAYLHPVCDGVPHLAQVCRRWSGILNRSTRIWKSLFIDPTHYTQHDFNTLSLVLRIYGEYIQFLTWKNNTIVYESIFVLIQKLRNLRYLRLPILWTSLVTEHLSSLTSLEDIQINGGYSLTDAHLDYIAKCFHNLKSVSLNACWGITADSVVRFVRALPRLQFLKLKVNSCLRLNDIRSEIAMAEGLRTVQSLSVCSSSSLVSDLCLHYVPIEVDELWTAVNSLPNLKKLNISNCEHLHGIRLMSTSLQKLYLFNLWSALFVSVEAANLKSFTVDYGLESLEHLEVSAPKLRRIAIDGSDVLRTINIKSQKLQTFEVRNCEMLDFRSLKDTLKFNNTLTCLKLGRLPVDGLHLNETHCPNIRELVLLDDFHCTTLHMRSPTLRVLQTKTERALSSLTHVYVIANHLNKIWLVHVPMLRCLTIQCVSVDSLHLNTSSSDQLYLESFIVHAIVAIGSLRMFDCVVNMLCLTTPRATSVVLCGCRISDYVLKMALDGCPNISYLNLETCHEFKNLKIVASQLQYLNLFGCKDVRDIHLECPQLQAVNLGQCTNAKLYVMGKECSHDPSNVEKIRIVPPIENSRWNHDHPPNLMLNDR